MVDYFKPFIDEIAKSSDLDYPTIEEEFAEIMEMVNIEKPNMPKFLLTLTESVKNYGFEIVRVRIKDINDDDEFVFAVSDFDMNVYDPTEDRYNKFISDLMKIAEGVKRRPCRECGNPYHKIEYFQMRSADESQSIRVTCTDAICGLVTMIS